MYIVAGDMVVNLANVKTVSIQEDNVLEFTYCDDTLSEIQFQDYGSALNALKQVIGKLGIDTDIGGALKV